MLVGYPGRRGCAPATVSLDDSGWRNGMTAVDPWLTEAIRSLFTLGVLAATGLTGYIWGRRRARERDLFLLWRTAFDRPAFRGAYQYHSSGENFRRAIATIIKSMATGILFDSSGHELIRVQGVYYGPSQIRSSSRREVLIEIQGRLQKLIRLSATGQQNSGLDNERDAIICRLNEVWRSLGIASMKLPTSYTDPGEIGSLVEELMEEERSSNPALQRTDLPLGKWTRG